MKAIVCDICGRKIDTLSRYVELYKGSIVSFNKIEKVDICLECTREIRRLVREKQNESTDRN